MNLSTTLTRSACCALALVLAACETDTGVEPALVTADAGGDAASDVSGGDADATAPEVCATAEAAGEAATGRVYVDSDLSERSLWDSGAFTPEDTPLASVPVTLIGAEGQFETATCADGTYGFGDLVGDVYVADVSWPEGALCRTRNCTRRFPDAVASGRVKIVTVGDSVPVIGAARMFPELLAEIVQPIALVENVNNAVSGSTSDQWVPGTANFDNRLEPHIESADVVIVSLGGNDFLMYANNAFSDVQGAIDGVPDFVREVMDRILWIKDEVQVRNPDVDLVYLLYPNYADSGVWEAQFGIALNVIRPLVEQALEQILDELAMEEDVIVVDFYGYFREAGLDLDDHLYDTLHFNAAGQEVYAERIFEALGGVRLGDDAIGLAARFALEPAVE